MLPHGSPPLKRADMGNVIYGRMLFLFDDFLMISWYNIFIL